MLLVYDRIVFFSIPRCCTFNASRQRSPFYFSWSNIARSLSIRSSAATSIARLTHMFCQDYFLSLFAKYGITARSYLFRRFFFLSFVGEPLFDQPHLILYPFYVRCIACPPLLFFITQTFIFLSFFLLHRRGWLPPRLAKSIFAHRSKT